jgi:uridine kinase
MDNFLLDRELREDKPMGRDAIHYEAFTRSMMELLQGRSTAIPRYDFIQGTSSHELSGRLKPGGIPLEIEPAGVLFLEGNFPFHLPEIADIVGLKIVYLTDDPVRLKRKWKRDVDYRKKYDPNYFRNRYFRTQFLRAEEVYRPLMERCDLLVDTTGAAIWLTPSLVQSLKDRT